MLAASRKTRLHKSEKCLF